MGWGHTFAPRGHVAMSVDNLGDGATDIKWLEAKDPAYLLPPSTALPSPPTVLPKGQWWEAQTLPRETLWFLLAATS